MINKIANQQKKRSLTKFLMMAKEYTSGEISTELQFRNYLTAWYCTKFNTTFKDPVFLDHTFEELVLLYFIHGLQEDPEQFEDMLTGPDTSYEDWLQDEMGDDYMSEEDYIKALEEFTNKEKKIAESLPDKIEIDFTKENEDVKQEY